MSIKGPFVSEKVPLESFIRAYVLGLPRKSYFYSMPVTWFEDQQRLCGPLSLLEVLCQKMRAQIDEAEFRLRGLVKANPKFFGYTRFGIEFCEWCYCVIYSRGLMVRGPDGIAIPILPPLFDLVNHSDDPNCFLESSVLDADDSRGVVSTDSGLYIVNPNGSVVRPDGGVIMSGPGQPLIVPLDGKLVIGQDKKAGEKCFSKEQEEKVHELMVLTVSETLDFYKRTEKQLPPKKDNEDLSRDRIFWTRKLRGTAVFLLKEMLKALEQKSE